MNPAILEAIGLALQVAFTLMQQQQMNAEEQEKFYQEQKTKFLQNNPATLPEV